MRKITYNWKRLIPMAILIVALFLFFHFRLFHYVSFDYLKSKNQILTAWKKQHFFLVSLAFIIIYIIAVAISIPGAVFLTLLGGFLFGPWLGTFYVVVSATLGATILFLAAKTAIGEIFAKKAGGVVKKMEKGFQENAVSYMLILRLIPLFPFWLVNIVPAILNVRLSIYIVTTFLGIIPGAFVYALIGNGLGHLFAQDQKPDLGIIFQPQILAPLIGLAILSMIPVFYKQHKKRKEKKRD